MSSFEIEARVGAEEIAGDDINDVFEDIFLAEERVIEESFHQGLEDGRQEESVKEAQDYGFKKGSEIGRELGFYFTIVTDVASQQEIATNEKAHTILAELIDAIEKFPRVNEPTVDLFHCLQQIRNKYRRLCALLKLPYRFAETNVLSF
ncbi:protein LTO1 homolog [Anopheles ziemanni]|uniref:protein LTO1 homolog n=1 Tax=Anopheles coustani TaxID=139045 RepID=UPI0026580C8F|nr:protein LTO1 homolog [Anopheles coustani]XP_058171907.1 protein LTO1 homolog [Anopheles ziemanni]